MSRSIIVGRLLEHYEPFGVLCLDEDRVRQRIHEVKPQRVWADREDTEDWHTGRIAHFIHLLNDGEALDALSLDSHCEWGRIYGPIVCDGHHRLCAAKIAGLEKIKADFSGRVDVLDYLTGRRKTYPQDAW